MPFEFGDFVPMAATSAPEAFDDPEFRFEPKLDGVRALAYADRHGRVRLQTRRGLDATQRYPAVGDAVAAGLDGEAAVLDGEVVALDERGVPDFSRALQAGADVSYFVFDVLAVGETPVVAEPLEARRARLVDLVAEPDEGLRVVHLLPGSGTRAFREAVRVGFEGVVAKRKGSPYRPGERSRDWIKVKRHDTADLVVGGWLPGKGALEGTVGALVLGAYAPDGGLRYVGRVGTGLTVAGRDALRASLRRIGRPDSPFAAGEAVPRETRFVSPTLVVEVRFLEVTRDLRLRAPAFLRVRDDKVASECTLAGELGWAVEA